MYCSRFLTLHSRHQFIRQKLVYINNLICLETSFIINLYTKSILK